MKMKSICIRILLKVFVPGLAMRSWAKNWANATILIWCNNLAVVNAFTSYRVRNSFLMAIIRSVWLYTAAYNINLVVKHISGTCNVYADVLSRWPYYCDLKSGL